MFSLRYRYLFILILSVYYYGNIIFVIGDNLVNIHIPYYQLFGVIFMMSLGVWEANRLIESKTSLNKKFAQQIHPLVSLFILSSLGIFVISIITMFTVTTLNEGPSWNALYFKLLVMFGLGINVFLNTVNTIYFFIARLKKTEVEATKLKKANLEAQFEALRTQINPHFLFNCLNALSTLVYKDADVSAKFIGQLSNVYRYLLYNQDKRLVTLKQELEFLDSYVYLLKIRFGENIVITQNIIPENEKMFVPPAAVQMLIENAIKHNIVSSRNPLKIDIHSSNGTLEVKNNLQEKTQKEESTFIGLANIRKRYAFLIEKEVKIEKTTESFKVALPLIKVDE
jgi:two-component system LytT family sensor kinase